MQNFDFKVQGCCVYFPSDAFQETAKGDRKFLEIRSCHSVLETYVPKLFK